jgi:hypothetical protein
MNAFGFLNILNPFLGDACALREETGIDLEVWAKALLTVLATVEFVGYGLYSKTIV